MNAETSPLILCSTPRLAHGLRTAHAREAQASGTLKWQTLEALTLKEWLERVMQDALLCGEIPLSMAPAHVLDQTEERLLWESIIEENLTHDVVKEFFDCAGMATEAQAANAMIEAWRIYVLADLATEETRQLVQWRANFYKHCKKLNWLDSARYFEWQIDQLENNVGILPTQLWIAGFDRISPQQQRLLDVLKARGTAIAPWDLTTADAGRARQIVLDDAEAERRAAVAWATERLRNNPEEKLAIIVPELATHRSRLMDLLDDTLHAAAVNPSRSEMPRLYEFSLGTSLATYPVIRCALALLRVATEQYQLPQQDISDLLRDVYWSASVSEADARARLDAHMRRQLSYMLHFAQVVRLAQKMEAHGIILPALTKHLQAFNKGVASWPRKQSVAAWAAAFDKLLALAGWPGERSLSSYEYQAKNAWQESLTEFGRLNNVLGNLTGKQAFARLARLVNERIFQPKTEHEVAITVMGMLENSPAPLDAVWVMGMNDHVWPPPPRLNSLLPAGAQRKAGAPNSSSLVQTQFAETIHQRLMHSAKELVFSSARKDGDRELRMSPIIKTIPALEEATVPVATMAERLAKPSDMEWLDDATAPPVAAGEMVNGGTQLIRAQAICPAWAFYQYRLGARKLKEPVEGLDEIGRGNLLHLALQYFWQGRDLAKLQAMDAADLKIAIQQAVENGVAKFSERLDVPMPANFLRLEKARLQKLLDVWLAFEKLRMPFTVLERELTATEDIAGISVRVTLDRVDELPDGRLIVIDYKTGNAIDYKSWTESRITEPQLPMYAAIVLAGQEIAAVAFAKVRIDEQRFIGIAAEDDTLPGIKGLEANRKLFSADLFPNWESVSQAWRTRIEAIAGEIKNGKAAVQFEDEQDLYYCDVKPLLRLPERALQIERQTMKASRKASGK